MNNLNEDDEPKNEKITTMWGASGKLWIVEYFFKRGIGVSEGLRSIIKEWFQYREYWRSLENMVKEQQYKVNELSTDKTELLQLLSRYFETSRRDRNENKIMKELLKKHNIKLP